MQERLRWSSTEPLTMRITLLLVFQFISRFFDLLCFPRGGKCLFFQNSMLLLQHAVNELKRRAAAPALFLFRA